jgi:RNA polymerase sigma-70 factor (ECF subfamily)
MTELFSGFTPLHRKPMRGTEQEAGWVIQAQCGDRDAMEHVLRSVQPPLRRYVLRLVGPTAADDVLQEVLIAIARKLTWLAEPRLFRAWAYRIASRAAFDHLRKAKRRGRHETDDEVLQALPAPGPRPSGDQLREMLDSAVLSPASRAVLMLHFQEEMPLAEIAAVLEIPLGTVKSRLAYGLAALRRHFADK